MTSRSPKRTGNSGQISVGIVGAGAIASVHLETLQGDDGITVSGITSRTRSKAEGFASKYGIPVCAGDMDSLVEKAKPDALMILVSVDQMYDVACSAMQYRLPLFIEKPAGMVPEETWNLARLARERSVKTMVGYNRRYYSIFHKGMDVIKEHGPLMGIAVEGHERFWRVRASGKHPEHVLSQWLYGNMTHTVDLLRFFGGEPTKVMSLAHRYVEPYGDQFGAVMEFESGAMGHYQSHWYSPGGWRVALYGEGVTVEFQPLESGRWIDKDFKCHELKPDEHGVRFKPGFFGQMEAFADLVRNGESGWPLQDLDGAHETMLLAQAISANLADRPQGSGGLSTVPAGLRNRRRDTESPPRL